ncbi:TPA: ABC transporter permease subunit [Staphylococcus pseudintermedius]|nr:ABC transporter permease subunit [Staphylococcus pseudintermedius]
MINIYKNEFVKTLYKKSNVIFFILFIIIISSLAFAKKDDSEVNKNWEQDLKRENIEYKNQIKKSNADVQKNLKEKIEKNNSYIKNDINPNKKNQYKFMISLLPIFLILSFYSLIMASSVVNDDFKYNTLKNIKASPNNSWKFIFNKYFVCLSIVIIWYTLTFIASFIIGGYIYEYDSFFAKSLYFSNGHNYIEPSILHITKIYLGEFLFLSVIIAMNFLFICVFKSQPISLLLSLLVMLFHNQISQKLIFFKYSNFIIFQHLSIKNKILELSLKNDYWSLFFSITVLASYSLIFLFLSSLFFDKKEV